MGQRLSAGDVTRFTDNLVSDYRRHCQAMPPELQEIQGKETMHAWLASNLVTIPDFHEEVEWQSHGADATRAHGERRDMMPRPILREREGLA